MVVLTIITQNNGETVYFDEPLSKVHFIKLISCSLYNSWHNLTRVGQITSKGSKNHSVSLPQGHYTVNSISKELSNNKIISIETDKPNSALKLTALFEINDNNKIQVSHALAQLIGTGTELRQHEYIKKLNSPSTYFIHCDLIDKNQNFLNNNKSDLLATFDIKGKALRKGQLLRFSTATIS